ncbi:hypothetical protein ABFS83_05G122100 [Erythranthe nasuta]
MPKPLSGPRDHTNPLIWCAAIICAAAAVAVIIAGAVVFIGYLVIKPSVPQIGVASAALDAVYFDQTSSLTVQVTIVVRAENDNPKARASFSGTTLGLSFRGQKIAYLVAGTFAVAANSTVELNYVPQSTPIPLDPEDVAAVSSSLRQSVMDFELKGTTKTRWRIWLVGSAKFWLHLDCRLHLPVNGSVVYPRCSSRSK